MQAHWCSFLFQSPPSKIYCCKPQKRKIRNTKHKGIPKRETRRSTAILSIIIINNKNNTGISKTLISKKTLFINKMQSPKRIEKTLEFGLGGKKGREEEDARKNCKRRRSLELTHLCFESKFHNNNNNTHCIHSQKCTSRHHLMIVFSSTSLWNGSNSTSQKQNRGIQNRQCDTKCEWASSSSTTQDSPEP